MPNKAIFVNTFMVTYMDYFEIYFGVQKSTFPLK